MKLETIRDQSPLWPVPWNKKKAPSIDEALLYIANNIISIMSQPSIRNKITKSTLSVSIITTTKSLVDKSWDQCSSVSHRKRMIQLLSHNCPLNRAVIPELLKAECYSLLNSGGQERCTRKLFYPQKSQNISNIPNTSSFKTDILCNVIFINFTWLWNELSTNIHYHLKIKLNSD